MFPDGLLSLSGKRNIGLRILHTAYFSDGLIKGLAGLPTTVRPSETSDTTAAPAPTMTFAPILICWRVHAPMPIQEPPPICVPPARCAPGLMWTKPPRMQSWSIVAAVLMIAPSPMQQHGWMTACAKITLPAPISTSGAMTAVG